VVLVGNSQCESKKQMVKLIGFTAHSAGKRKLAFSGALI
jgi:hypothetical protein